MSKEKPPETDSPNPAIPTAAAEWLTVFKKHFSIAFKDEVESLSKATPQDSDLQQAAVGAMISTLRDSGLSEDNVLGFLGEAFRKVQSEPVEWTTELAQRARMFLRSFSANIRISLAIFLDELVFPFYKPQKLSSEPDGD